MTLQKTKIGIFSGRRGGNEEKKENILRKILCVFALIPAIILIILFSYIFSNGISAINIDFLLNSPYMLERGGIFPQIIGSLCLVSVCLLFAVPLGVLSAIYLAEYAPDNALTGIILSLIHISEPTRPY